MARVLSTAFCVALLAATAVAFALTEGAKTQLSPIFDTSIPRKVFSPTCRCGSDVAPIDFRVRKRQHLEVWMERNGKRVSTIVSGRTFAKGWVDLEFTGIADNGTTILPDGIYQPVIRIIGDHRTITLPNKIELDTIPPRPVKLRRQRSSYISPGCDCPHGVFVERYTLDEKGHGVLLVDGQRVWFTRGLKLAGDLTWDGKIGGRLAKAGRYVLSFVARDEAGNRSTPIRFAVVTVRYLALGRARIHVAPRRRFALFVLTDAKKVHWRLDRGRGVSRSHTLRIRAPRKRGRYRLYVTALGHTATATVIVG